MKYQSKKNPEIIASLDFKEEKFKTVRLIYLTGPDAGKSVSITESTFKRWWKKYEEPAELNSDGSITKSEEVVAPAKNSPLDCLNIDYMNKLCNHCMQQENKCDKSECPFCSDGCDIVKIAEQLKAGD